MALFHLSNRRLSGSFSLGRHGEKQRGAGVDLLVMTSVAAVICFAVQVEALVAAIPNLGPDLRSSGLQRASRRLDPAVHRPVSDFHLFPFQVANGIGHNLLCGLVANVRFERLRTWERYSRHSQN